MEPTRQTVMHDHVAAMVHAWRHRFDRTKLIQFTRAVLKIIPDREAPTKALL
jgi:hypothetical protein